MHIDFFGMLFYFLKLSVALQPLIWQKLFSPSFYVTFRWNFGN